MIEPHFGAQSRPKAALDEHNFNEISPKTLAISGVMETQC